MTRIVRRLRADQMSDELLIEHLLVALQLGNEGEAQEWAREVERRGLGARAMVRAWAKTRAERRRLGAQKGQDHATDID